MDYTPQFPVPMHAAMATEATGTSLLEEPPYVDSQTPPLDLPELKKQREVSGAFSQASDDEKFPVEGAQPATIPVSGEEVARKKREEDKEEEEQTAAQSQSDLLLDIAMTTAFASLLNGTPIQDARSLASFLCIFFQVWWVWASHVAYNARFREYDWPHRVFLFFQLLVFCAFAAFTNNFDIENGIVDDATTQQKLAMLRADQGWSNSTIMAQAFTEDRAPVLNIRGLSMTMAFSRVLLLAQYLYAWGVKEKSSKNWSLFFIQCSTLMVSIGCYLASFFVIGSNPGITEQIAKLPLWFVPIVLEIISHFVVSFLAKAGNQMYVRYDAKMFNARAATVFIIILGGGLDNLTQGFHFMVGNLSFGVHRIGVIFCSCIVFILLFTLHFTVIPAKNRDDIRDKNTKRKRDLGLFFFEFFYLCAVVITLQGIAAMLQVGNVGDSMQSAFQFLRESENVLNSTGFAKQLTSDIYDANTVHRLQTDGYDVDELLVPINNFIPPGPDPDATTAYEVLLVVDMNILGGGLQVINALPQDSANLIRNEILAFVDANFTDVNRARFIDVAEMTITAYATPALWFSSAGGAVLLLLGATTLIDRWGDMHLYVWIQVASRFVVGILLIILVSLDKDASTVFLDKNYQYTGSRIWRFATESWILPAYALVLLLEQLWEYLWVYLARKKYDLPKNRFRIVRGSDVELGVQ
ncbi:hypothetical protein EIP91_008757 [Steccherinum ochraceum]|uniref:Uncharacterized protein n=1 Tax=Steccherinum ochraceum TaxID=92696 RepID=A0A4R0RS37_9APHY|nr:hypothetical protein EIP91_008757 [Steccherinum ochraceum]